MGAGVRSGFRVEGHVFGARSRDEVQSPTHFEDQVLLLRYSVYLPKMV